MQITLISRIIQRTDYWISRSDVSKMILPLNCVCVACICGNKFFQLECRQARNVWQVAFKWHLSFWSPLFPIIPKASYSLLLSLVSSSSLLCFLLSCLFFLFSVVPLHFIETFFAVFLQKRKKLFHLAIPGERKDLKLSNVIFLQKILNARMNICNDELLINVSIN